VSALENLFNKFGCDKAKKHHYHLIYQDRLASFKDKQFNLLEVGIFRGESIKAWLEYFPQAQIYGIDIFTRVKVEDIDVLQDPRVHWLKTDSTQAGVQFQMSSKWKDVQFDVVIDDGLHTPRANADTLKNIWPRVADRGQYFIEDVWPLDTMTSQQLQHPWLLRYPERYNQLEMNYFRTTLNKVVGDSQIIDHDNRKLSGEPDSYIIEVVK